MSCQCLSITSQSTIVQGIDVLVGGTLVGSVQGHIVPRPHPWQQPMLSRAVKLKTGSACPWVCIQGVRLEGRMVLSKLSRNTPLPISRRL
jgi:hypothetical protein